MDGLLNLLDQIEIPDTYPYLMGVLGLTLIWKFHDLQVKYGRIKAVDVWKRSGIRMFVHVTPNDSNACSHCREADGTAFLPAVVASKKFTALGAPCTNPTGCRCLMVGLYGAWKEAVTVQVELGKNGGKLKLSGDDVQRLLEGARRRYPNANVDDCSISLLEAVRAEGADLETAIARYRYVADNAVEDRDRFFIIPAYLRLSYLYELAKRPEEALKVVDRVLKASGDRSSGLRAQSEDQVAVLSLRKARLLKQLNR